MQSKNLRAILVIGIIVSMLSVMWIPSTQATRPSGNEIPLGATTYYEFNVKSFGNYAVFERAYNDDLSASIDHDESSWIVLSDITDGTELNITPSLTLNAGRGASHYYHSISPDIDGDHVVYVEKYSTGDVGRLMMYNITDAETWNMNSVCSGVQILQVGICGDWIYIQYLSTVYRGILYNFNTGVSKSFNSAVGTIYTLNNPSLGEEYFTYTLQRSGGSLGSAGWVFNITSYAVTQIQLVTGYTSFNTTGVSSHYVAGTYHNTTSYRDLAIIDIYSYNSTSHLYDDINFYEQNTSITTYSGLIDDNWVAINWWYGWGSANLQFANITAWDFVNNETVEITTGYCNQLSDYTNDRVYFITNRNSGDPVYGDARDNWDVYYTETSLTAMMDGLTDVMLPMIIVVVVIGLLGAFFAFKMN